MRSVYNDIASHWCGDSYDCLCGGDYTSKEVKDKRSCFHYGFSSRRAMKLGGRERRVSWFCVCLVIFDQEDYSVMLFFVHVSSLSC